MIQKRVVMTTKELADYIKIHEKTVIKQAQAGKLPGVKIGNQWRFHLDAIDAYLQGAVVKMRENDLNEIIQTAEEIIPISRLTDSSLIALNVDARDQEDVLNAVTMIAQKAGILSQPKEFIALLKERERLCSTAVGEGIAIPHPRNPVLGMFQSPHIIIVRTKTPVDFNAPDNSKVNLFFAICATNEFVHLRLLAKISKMLHEKELRNKIIAARSKQELLRLLVAFGRKGVFPLSEKHTQGGENES